MLLSILQGYQSSGEFLGRAARTRFDYIRPIKAIEKEFGDFPLSALTDRRTRGVFMAWRDRLANRSRRQADYAWTVLALILAWALNRGLIAANPCEKGGRLYTCRFELFSNTITRLAQKTLQSCQPRSRPLLANSTQSVALIRRRRKSPS